MQKGWTFFRFVIAVILAIAAIAKFVNMTEILAANSLLSNRLLLTVAIGVEFGVAVFLLLSDSFWPWAVTVVLFLIFSAASIYAIASGQDCNCISKKIGPKVMLPFDLAMLAIASLVRPARKLTWDKRLTMMALSCLFVGGMASLAAASSKPAAQSDRLQFLLADMLVQQPWPLNASLHPDLVALETDRWMVLVVRSDCEHCRELLSKHFADPESHRPNERTAVFVAGSSEWPFQLDHVSIDGEKTSSIKWPIEEPFVASPAIFLLENGKVVDARDGDESDIFMKSLL